MKIHQATSILIFFLVCKIHSESFSLALEKSGDLNAWTEVPISSSMLSSEGKIIVNKEVGVSSTFFRIKITENTINSEPTEKWSFLGSISDNANWGRQISSYSGSIYSLSENGGNFVKYNLTTKIFSNLTPPPYSTWGSIYKWLNGKYYVIGGYNSSKTLSYDPNTDLWITLADAPRQGFFQAVALNGKIYLIGGTPGGLVNYYSQCSVFDPSSGWSALPSLPAARSGAAVISEGNDIYVIGGAASSSSLPSNTVYKFNTQTSSWSMLPSILTSRSNAQAISDNGNIYIIGGYPQSGESAQVGFSPSPLEKYQISSGSWISLPSLQYSGGTLYEGITILNGSIYMLNNAQRFDLAKNQWFSLLPCPEVVTGKLETFNGKIYWVSRHTTPLSVYEYTP